MLFNSINFLIFLVVVISTYYVVKPSLRWVVLLLASYYFYMSWNPAFIILIVFSTLIDFWAGLKIYNSTNKKERKKFLIMSLISNLGLLFFFKYFNFFIDSVNSLPIAAGSEFELFDIILPVGISFYTFQTLSYSIDIYRGSLKPIRHLGEFALFVTFFPQLVAGPIERATSLIPQLRKLGRVTADKLEVAIVQVVWGFFMKIVIADNLSVVVDQAYSNYETLSGFRLILPMFLFSFQIYADFAGYSLIALGIAKFFGVDLMTNFRSPYVSSSLTEFWSRWHISLSTWFRDYLYIPLGGNKRNKLKATRNLLIVFLISGLWHGAAWNFVIWGLIHAVILIVEKNIKLKITPSSKILKSIYNFSRIVLTFIIVTIAWVFFRAKTLDQALVILTRSTKDLSSQIADIGWMLKSFVMRINDVNLNYFSRWFQKSFPVNAIPSIEFLMITGVLAISVLIYYDFKWKTQSLANWLNERTKFFRIAFVSIICAMIFFLGQFTSENQFIYFQF